ncbi:aminoacyl-tRNA hydrolase [bacterium]|nr:aminoacyl-tRNA hydrolase [bacterium]MBU1754542.1 aminoacyl-tRNA hydrolase [bacterium]
MIFKKETALPSDKWIIIGLGNPGERYGQTRHNVGFMVINHLCKLHNINLGQNKCQARIGEGNIEEKDVVLVKPDTFMNLSGKSIVGLCNRYRVSASQIIVIHDDVSLSIGKLRVRAQGSSGGHNGVQSIIDCLGTKEFPRIRIGIGSPMEGVDMAEFVLSRFEENEKMIIIQSIEAAAMTVSTIIVAGVVAAMNKN